MPRSAESAEQLIRSEGGLCPPFSFTSHASSKRSPGRSAYRAAVHCKTPNSKLTAGRAGSTPSAKNRQAFRMAFGRDTEPASEALQHSLYAAETSGYNDAVSRE